MIGKLLTGLAGREAMRRTGAPAGLLGLGLAAARRSPPLAIALAAGAGVMAFRRARRNKAKAPDFGRQPR